MKITSYLVAILLIAGVEKCYAWEACMPFCDLECSGAAMTSLAATTTSALSTVKATCYELESARYDTAAAITTAISNMSSSVTSYYQGMFTGLDASTSKIVQSTDAQTIAFSNLVDLINSTIWGAMNNSAKTKQFFINQNRYADYARSNSVYLTQNVCDDCDVEPVYEILKRLEAFPTSVSTFATIVNDGSMNWFGNRRDREHTLAFQNSQSQFLTMPNSDWGSTNTLAKAYGFQNIFRFTDGNFGDARRELLAIAIGKYHSKFSFYDTDKFKKLNSLSSQTGASTDSLIKGNEVDTLVSPDSISESTQLNHHGLLHKLAISMQVESSQYLALLEITSIKNVIMALDIADESFD